MHWGISEPADRTDLDVSRATWRVGQLYWLSQSESRRSIEVIGQANLLHHLRKFLQAKQAGISAPEIVPGCRELGAV